MRALFAFTANDHWEPGIGDPTVVGWVTVVAYFVAAYLSWQAARGARPRPGQSPGPFRFWTIFALGLVFLGFNKQLDLQTWFTLFLKKLALEEGWYQVRRTFQALFIAGVALAGLLSLSGLRALAGRNTRPIRTALVGGVFLGCFILIRASSFHHVDQMLGMDLGGLRVNWILELGSISCIAFAAWLARSPRPEPVPPDAPNFIWVSAGERLKGSSYPPVDGRNMRAERSAAPASLPSSVPILLPTSLPRPSVSFRRRGL
jgi:hypothetical protein